MHVEVDTLSVLGAVFGGSLIAIGLAVLVGVPNALGMGIGVALGHVVGALGTIAFGAGLLGVARRDPSE